MTTRRLPHGFTNETWASGRTVSKRYLGPDAELRMRRELDAIDAASAAVPTPRVLSADLDRHVVELERVAGDPGQSLIERGLAAPVLQAAGRTLSALHTHADRPVTHGDYGPQNLLFDASGETVVLVADWEFATTGSDPLADLAWAEWIVRMHHPDETASIGALYEGYGQTPPWSDRQRTMVARCEALRLRCTVAGDVDAEQMWEARRSATLAWDSDEARGGHASPRAADGRI